MRPGLHAFLLCAAVSAQAAPEAEAARTRQLLREIATLQRVTTANPQTLALAELLNADDATARYRAPSFLGHAPWAREAERLFLQTLRQLEDTENNPHLVRVVNPSGLASSLCGITSQPKLRDALVLGDGTSRRQLMRSAAPCSRATRASRRR